MKALAIEVGGDVEFLGFVSGEPLWKWVREARAIVLPSEWYENAPMSVLEAYACGKPVIGAQIGGIPEMVRGGETGLLFGSGKMGELADCMHRLAIMPDDAVAGMGRAARQYVSTTFTHQRYLNDMLALYAELGVAAGGTRRTEKHEHKGEAT